MASEERLQELSRWDRSGVRSVKIKECRGELAGNFKMDWVGVGNCKSAIRDRMWDGKSGKRERKAVELMYQGMEGRIGPVTFYLQKNDISL